MPTPLPKCLYRYRPLRPKGRRTKQRVIEDELRLLGDGHIWASNPKDLNDPFDCRPIFEPAQKAALDEVMNRLLIGSMSAVAPDDALAGPMWCHYADDHRGFCIEYPLEPGAALKLPLYQVRYTDERLDIRGLDPRSFRIASPARIGVALSREELADSANNIPIEDMTRKSRGWQPEQEWRAIWPANIRESDAMLAEYERLYGPSHKNRFFVSKPGRIVLGAHMQRKLRTELSARIRALGIEPVIARLSETENRVVLG